MRYAHLTRHADARINQRGSKLSAVLLLRQVADREIHLGDGACVVAISHKKAEQLRRLGFASAFVEKLERVSLIIAEDTGDVMSIIKGALSQSYREGGHRQRRGGRRQG